MYDYDYNYGMSNYYVPDISTAIGRFLGFLATLSAFFWICSIVLTILKFWGTWKAFKKAGVDGWEGLIPYHSAVVKLRLSGIPTYIWFLLLIPFVNIVVYCFYQYEYAKSYGKSVGFAIGLILLNPIFMAILGLGNSQYVGPAYNSGNNNNNNYSNNNINYNSNVQNQNYGSNINYNNNLNNNNNNNNNFNNGNNTNNN